MHFRWLRSSAQGMRGRSSRLFTLDIVVLLTAGGVGLSGLICWPEYYVADLALPIALIVLYATLRAPTRV
jgi:hypothetical protein